jgi:plasmid maintenance system antidote protein VapI
VGTSCVETVGEHSRLQQVASGCQFVQREMPWLASMPPPQDASRAAIALCTSTVDAFRASLLNKKFSRRKYAALLGVSHNTIGKWARDEMPIAEEWIDRICVVTGTRLLRQWIDLQTALDAITRPSEAQRIESIAKALRAA